MFKTMKQGFGWAVGYILGAAVLKAVAEALSDGFKGRGSKKEAKPEETK